MNDFLKMAKLDFLSIKPQLLSYLAVIPAVLIFGITSKAIAIILFSFTVAWYEALSVTNIFMIQEKNGLDRLYNSLSINLNDIVLGRYIFVLFTYIITYIITISLFAIIIGFSNINGLIILIGFSLSLLYFSVITGIQFPICFKIGYTKAKVWHTILFFSMLLAILPLISVFSDVTQWVQSNQYIAIIISLFSCCMIQFVSYRISLVSYSKRI